MPNMRHYAPYELLPAQHDPDSASVWCLHLHRMNRQHAVDTIARLDGLSDGPAVFNLTGEYALSSWEDWSQKVDPGVLADYQTPRNPAVNLTLYFTSTPQKAVERGLAIAKVVCGTVPFESDYEISTAGDWSAYAIKPMSSATALLLALERMDSFLDNHEADAEPGELDEYKRAYTALQALYRRELNGDD